MIVLVLSIVYLVSSLNELNTIVGVLKGGNLWFLGLAFFVEILWFFIPGLTYHSLYSILELKENFLRLTLVAVGAVFLNIIAPSVGVSGMALFVEDGKARDHSPGKVLAAGSISLFIDYLAFLCILVVGVIVLFKRRHLDSAEIIPFLILLFLTISFAIILTLGSRSREGLADLLEKVGQGVNRMTRRVARREMVHIERTRELAFELSDGLLSIHHKYPQLLFPFLLALLNKIVLIIILILIFLAFQVPFSAGTVIGGFSIGYLFMIISPTPAGVGFMEGAFILGLNSLNVAWSAAVVIALTYRAITFWIPLGVGAVAFHYLNIIK